MKRLNVSGLHQSLGDSPVKSQISQLEFYITHSGPVIVHLGLLNRSMDTILQAHPQTGIIPYGDFNHLPIAGLKKSYKLKQRITKPTSNDAMMPF